MEDSPLKLLEELEKVVNSAKEKGLDIPTFVSEVGAFVATTVASTAVMMPKDAGVKFIKGFFYEVEKMSINFENKLRNE